jgi:hypothetical protein
LTYYGYTYQVTLWIPLPPGRGARDVKVVFSPRELHVAIGDENEGAAAAAAGAAVVLGGALKVS